MHLHKVKQIFHSTPCGKDLDMRKDKKSKKEGMRGRQRPKEKRRKDKETKKGRRRECEVERRERGRQRKEQLKHEMERRMYIFRDRSQQAGIPMEESICEDVEAKQCLI